MKENTLGKNILELRRNKGITQETLAEVAGVSPQAVSKWESGGSPDVELLPVLADFFGVSIDILFGRNVTQIDPVEFGIMKSIISLPREQRFIKAFEYCWEIEKSLSGFAEKKLGYSLAQVQQTERIHSQILLNEGFALMSLQENLRYFFVMLEPDCGIGNEFFNMDNYSLFFRFVSDKDVLKTLFFLFERENKASFTPKLLEKAIGITNEKAMEILDGLLKYRLLTTSEIEIDDEIQKVFNFQPNPAFVALLTMCDEIIKRPNNFTFYKSDRSRAYLHKQISP